MSGLRTEAESSASGISVSALDSLTLPRHRWYFFKEAFSPALVQRAVQDIAWNADDLIVDPFCGSGTVPLEAAAVGRPSQGTEVNPFLAFVSKAKLQQCSAATLEGLAQDAVRAARRGRESPLKGFSTFSKRPGLTKWLFSRSILDAFEGAWSRMAESRKIGAGPALLRLCLIGAAMDVCNATKDGKCLRYRSDWRTRAYGASDFIAAFEARLAAVLEDVEIPQLGLTRARIRRGDARRSLPSPSFRLCITSPPYLNSFDYTDVYRPELFLGKWVRTMPELRALRLQTLRSHIQVDWPRPRRDDFGSLYSETMKIISARKSDLWRRRILLMIQAYFEDMRQVLVNLRARAAPDASVWIVVSNSAYSGIEIPVDLILAEVAAQSGWYLREVSVLRYLKRIAGQQWSELSGGKSRGPHLRESLIILDSQPRGALLTAREAAAGARGAQ